MARLRLPRPVHSNDAELVLLAPLQLLEGEPGGGTVHHLPGLPLAAHCTGLNVVGCDGGPAIVNGRLPLDGHGPLIPVNDFWSRGGQGNGWKGEEMF